MPIFHNRIYDQKNTSAGGLTITTSEVRGLLRHIIVSPATSTTVYNFTVSDGSSLKLFGRDSETGELNETVQIPVQSQLIVAISSATSDELFKIYLAIQEES